MSGASVRVVSYEGAWQDWTAASPGVSSAGRQLRAYGVKADHPGTRRFWWCTLARSCLHLSDHTPDWARPWVALALSPRRRREGEGMATLGRRRGRDGGESVPDSYPRGWPCKLQPWP